MISRPPLVTLLAGLFLLLTLEGLAIGWLNDRASCERQIPARLTSNQRARVLYDFLAFEASHDLRHAALWHRQERRITFIRIPRCNQVVPDQ